MTELEAIRDSAVKRKAIYAEALELERQRPKHGSIMPKEINEQAIKLLRDIAAKDEGVFDASDGIPAREMLADMLLDMGRPEAVLVESGANLTN